MKPALMFTIASLATCAGSGAANAQMRLVPANPVVLVSDLLRDDAGQYNEEGIVEERPGLPPRAILSMLDSSGFSVLSPPIRRGPAYVVAVIDPNGTDGRVIVDASSGRIVRFRPIFGQGAMVIPDDVRAVYARHDLIPPRSIPNVRPRSVTKLADRAPTSTDPSISGTRTAAPTAVQQEKTAAAAAPQPAKPIGTKPTIQIQPTQPMPPVQGFD